MTTMRLLISLLLLTSLALPQQGLQGKVQLTGAAIVKATSHTVTLSWTRCPYANSYNLYRATTHGGPYKKIVSALVIPKAVDENPQHGATYYYVVTAVNAQGESGYSSETVVNIP